MNGVKVLATL